jgi:hypothetical protein
VRRWDAAPNEFETDTVIELETNLDDLSAELTGAAMGERLLALGALDVTLPPLQMKKERVPPNESLRRSDSIFSASTPRSQSVPTVMSPLIPEKQSR